MEGRRVYQDEEVKGKWKQEKRRRKRSIRGKGRDETGVKMERRKQGRRVY